MTSLLRGVANLLSPTGQARLDPDDQSNVVGNNESGGTTTQGRFSFNDENEDDDGDETMVHPTVTPAPSTSRGTRLSIVLPASDDPPIMGVMQMSKDGTQGAFVGGKPLPDWSGLDPETIPVATPAHYRGEAHEHAKSYHYRVKGLETKITPKDDLRETARNVEDHLIYYGLDTIAYVRDPANPTVMESVVDKPNMFSKNYVMTQVPIYTSKWDRYDKENDACATKFFIDSCNEEVKRKLRDALATTKNPTFVQVWMTFVEKIRVISVGRVDGLQKRVEARLPSQYPGQNLDTMGAQNIRDIIDLEQAGWYNLSTGNTMVRNFASANPECPAFTWFAQSFVARYEAAVTHCFHMNKNECKGYMDANGFGYEEICNVFADYYRKANQDGRWLPTKTVRDTNGAPKNFANQALVQNGTTTEKKRDKDVCNNCGKTGHWARDCKSKSTKSNPSNNSSSNTSKKSTGKNKSGSTPWTKVPPTADQPQSKTMHDKTFYWCGTCKRWTTTHKTSEHKSKESTNTTETTTTTPSNVSLLATSMDFAAWHVSIDTDRKDVKAKENYWLNLIKSFIINYIWIPIQLVMWFVIGIGILTTTAVALVNVTNVLGYGILAPFVWINTMLIFIYLQPIMSYVEPAPPPPPMPRWKKRKVKAWFKKQMKNGLACNKTKQKPNIDSFHRSYPLRHRSNGKYFLRKDLLTRREECARQQQLFDHLLRLEVGMKDLYSENVLLKRQVKYLVQQRNASRLHCPTPFEREKESRREQHLKIRKELCKIRTKFNVVRGFVNDTPVQLRKDTRATLVQLQANIAQCDAPPARTFLNIVYSYLPSFNKAETMTTQPKPDVKTVIWDSGSSMAITNDRSEFMVNEYEALPNAQTVTGISSTKVKILGVGMVSWCIEDVHGNLRTLELPCLYVPDSKQRLLSTSGLLKQYPNESINLSDGKFTLSGSNTTSPIDAYIDTNNNLPTSILCDPSSRIDMQTQMQSCIAVVAEANQNLSEPEKELLRWHQRLAHLDFNKIKFLFRTGVLARSEASRSLQTTASKLKEHPRCAACQFGKQCQQSVPPTTTSKVADAVGAISKDVDRPGQQICIDHFVCRNKGRLFTSKGKTVPTNMYSGGCIFVDSYSGFVHVELQKHLNAIETIEAKERFESMVLDYGVIPQTYLSDNGGAFTSNAFASKIKEFEQSSKFAGAGAHHHNGVAERNIRTIISIARTMMMHSAMHWPAVSDVELWPMAVKYAVHVFNRMPSVETGICPLDKFTRQRFQQNKLHDLHVWGCPVYVLDKKIPDGIKIPKWAPRSSRYIYMGVSDKHSSTVPLVLNPETGVISPQFHVVVDEWFATIATSTGEMPDFNKDEWKKMFGENARHYMWDDEDDVTDEQHNLPSPELEAIDRREQRISNAIEQQRPPVALPVPDPPTASLPTQNRFEPLSTFDDENFEPHLILGTNQPTLTINESSPQREQPAVEYQIQDETVDDNADEVEIVSESSENQVPVVSSNSQHHTGNHDHAQNVPVDSNTTPPRRSNRARRAPDRLNLYMESNSCFYIQSENWGLDSQGDDVFTYLTSALCSTTPPIHQASTLISSDSFKASLGDPDTLSWDQAMKDIPNLDEWMKAAVKEIEALEKHGTWVLDDKSNATSKILPGTWVFRIKRAPDGSILKFKARYCVRGDLQTDLHETYAPVVGWSTIRLFLILSLLLHWTTKSIDFSQAFVQALLGYPVWIHLPRGFHTTEGDNKCLKLVKSLYGLSEAPRLWYLHLFDALVNKLGFTQSKLDPCLLMKDGMMIVVFVDDCAISYRDEADYIKLIANLRKLGFELTEEGSFSKFLGINFAIKNNTIHMTQTGLIDRIADATGLTDSNPNHTPTQQDAIGKDIDGLPMSEDWSYRSVVGMLLYLSTNTRPDIAYAVSQVARFSNNPKKSHATAVKTIVRYLVGTRLQGTVVTPTGKLDIKLYVDADFAGLFKREADNDPDCARSRTGYILLLGGFPLIWKSHLQTKIALSTLEAEYSALSSATRALIPIRELLFEISRTVAIPKSLTTTISCTIFEDNQGAYLLATTQRISARTRYFTVEFHHFWEFIKLEDENQRKILLEKIDTKNQGADFLTKGQPKLIYRSNRFLILGW